MDDPQSVGAALRRRRSKATGPEWAQGERPGRPGTRTQLLDAAEKCLRSEGFAKFSTRGVAELAGMPLSQIHYHFGSREGLLLALLDYWNERLLQRQKQTFEEPLALWQRWERACDYLDEDLESGYVRTLQEMIAAGWSNPEIASAVRRDLRGWYTLIDGLAKEAEQRFGSLGRFTSVEVACLVGNAFIGSEALILLGLEGPEFPARNALRKFGALIRQMEGDLKPRRGQNRRTSCRRRS